MADIVTQYGITIRETAGREGTDGPGGTSTASRSWLCQGSASPLTCRDALSDSGAVPFSWDGLRLDSVSRERVTDDSWEFTANYAQWKPEVGGYTVGIDTTGGTLRVTHAYAQTAYNASGETATDYGTAIDVRDGVPQGVDRIIPALKLNIRAKIDRRWLSTPIAYAKLIASLTGSTNNATLLTFAQGELLFAGATGDIISESDPELMFSFLASGNIAGETIGSIANITKKGHEYLWYDFKPKAESSNGLTVPKIRAAYVGRVYGEADLSVLKIGVPHP